MRVPAVRSWVEQGKMHLVENDVLDIVQQVKALDDRLDIYFNEWKGGFDVVEHCLDGTDRLVFHVDELDQRVVGRLLTADHWHGRSDPSHVKSDSEDFLAEIDSDNDQFFKDQDEAGMEKIRDAGERLAWALEQDGKGTKAQIHIPGWVKWPN